MSTRSRIGYQLASGKVKSVYCHNDGYVEVGVGVGHQLHTHHNSLAAAKAIVALGDLSSLHEFLAPPEGASHSFGDGAAEVTVAYARDRGDKDCKAVTSKDVAAFLAIESWQDYAYLFKDGEWLVHDYDTDPPVFEKLSLALGTERVTS